MIVILKGSMKQVYWASVNGLTGVEQKLLELLVKKAETEDYVICGLRCKRIWKEKHMLGV